MAKIPSPEEWMAQQGMKPAGVVNKIPSPEEWMAQQSGPDYKADVEAFRSKNRNVSAPGNFDTIKDIGAGAWHGVTAPVRGVRQLFNYATGDTGKLKQLMEEEEKDYNALGTAGKGANIAAQVGTAFIPVAGQIGKLAQFGGKGAQLAAKAGSAATGIGSAVPKTLTGSVGLGALQAGAQPLATENGEAKNFGSEKLKQIAMGAGLGAGAHGLGKVLGGGSEAVKRASEDLGGIATPGQLLQAAKPGFNATEWERRLGMVLPGSNILNRRDLANEAGVTTMLAREAEKAGVNVKDAAGFKDIFNKVQTGKKQGYEDVVPNLSFGKDTNKLASELSTTFTDATRGLTAPMKREILDVLSNNGLHLSGKVKKGAYEGINVQSVLSELNQQISSRFAHNATRQDNVVGESLVKLRDKLLDVAEKNSPKGAADRYKALNRLHQMTGSDVQSKKGVFGRAGTYINAEERGAPSLRELQQAAGAGRQTKARNEIREEASRLSDIAGKHSTAGQGEISKLFRLGANVATLGASPWTLGAQFAPALLYNERSLKMLNKLAQEGNPEAQRMLVQLSHGANRTTAQGE